ncbi:MAG: hypothetical protein AAF943_15790 [Pseudomonadota bacterium]
MPTAQFSNHEPEIIAPISAGEAATPGTDFRSISRGIFIGGTGDIRLRMKNGEELLFRNAQAGVVYPFQAQQVVASGTTASDIVALY